MSKYRESTVRNIIPNLRYRWKEELRNFSDNAIAAMYEDFSFSDDHGNNDEKLPEWFELLPDYEKRETTG